MTITSTLRAAVQVCGPEEGCSGPRIKKPMLAARLSKALPRVAQAVRGRAMTSPTISEQLGSVKDVKVKDIPQWASSVQKDPKTEAAVKVHSERAGQMLFGCYLRCIFVYLNSLKTYGESFHIYFLVSTFLFPVVFGIFE